jgi:hypothetical protein
MRVSKNLFGFMAAPVVFIAALALSINAAIPASYTGKPYCCDTLKGHYQQIPGKVVCVFFDSGGEGVAFHYPGGCGSGGATMRKNAAGQTIAADAAVCMQQYNGNDHIFGSNPCQPEAGYWHLAWITPGSPTDPGEWLKFTVHVNMAGMYNITFHEGTGFYPNLQLLTFYDGQNVKTDSISNMRVDTPSCIEPWHAWATTLVDSVQLDTGLQVIQISFKVGSWNLDWIQFTLKSGTGTMEPVNLRHAGGSMNLKTAVSRNVLSISYNAVSPAVAKIHITDCAGRSVFRTLDNCGSVGRRSTALSVQNLRHGVYFLQLEQNGTKAISSFVFK